MTKDVKLRELIDWLIENHQKLVWYACDRGYHTEIGKNVIIKVLVKEDDYTLYTKNTALNDERRVNSTYKCDADILSRIRGLYNLVDEKARIEREDCFYSSILKEIYAGSWK